MQININDKVKDLIDQYPNLKEVLASLGFTDILNPLNLNTVGRFVSLSKGAKMKNIVLKYIIEKLEEKGTLEVTQDIKPIKMIEGTKRLR